MNVIDFDKQLYEDIGAIKTGLTNVEDGVQDMRDELKAVTTDHSGRLGKLETQFAAWKGRMAFASTALGAFAGGVVLFVKYMLFGRSD